MSGLDWLVFAVYFGAVVAFAWRQSRKNRGVEGFFLANRRLGWGAIGLSVMATQASAITYIGTTGQAFDDGMEFVQFYLGQPIAMVILCVVFIPFFYRSKVFTAYEYLERRFDPRTRSLTSFLFLVSRGLSAGIVLYAPAIVLSVIMGWDERVTILVMGLITVAYTIMGGITAVIWTDVLQMIVMFAGIAIAIAVLFATLPEGVGVGDVAYIGGIHEMWRSIDLSWDPTNRYTLWSGLIGGLFLALGYFGTDQSQVQRYLTASSLRQSRLSLIFNAFVKVPMQIFILAIGVLLYVFYHFERPPLVFNSAEAAMVAESPRAGDFAALEAEHERTHQLRRESTLAVLEARRTGEDPGAMQRRIAAYDDELARLREESKSLVSEVRGASSNDVNYVFPSYLIAYVPAGILGLLIAVIFAAAMSSLDSELTALSSATVIDFYRRYVKPEGTDAHYLLISRLATLGWGGFAVLFALYAGQLGSLVEAVNEVGSIFYGALLGVFLLAFLVKRATAAGAFYGLISSMLAVLAVSRFTEIAWLWYNVVGTLAVLVVGLALRRRERPA
ncbi:sodium:solute symporter [Candidatus Palauibacter polyketidifaciens]|uniref:sodium:solute symporter n=1 Tax=Candidatus Palauibacter polyketidifaciens TaxID=3056740 RepID=UPI0023908FA8|nr:sodium:solute symporter [Candidatus Palauibacter polyketidifaciens]MDE2719342.1 sodium:solute symporter [Candidatus Palauibacter polyketidifaciens]